MMKPYDIFRLLKINKPMGALQSVFTHLALKVKQSFYLNKLNNYKQSQAPLFTPKMLVVMHKSGLGNAIEATPLVQAIRALLPKSHITLLVPKGDLFLNWCVPDAVFTTDEALQDKTFDHTFFTFTGTSPSTTLNSNVMLGKIYLPKIWQDKWFLKPERDYNLAMLKPFGKTEPTPPLYVSITKPTLTIASSPLRIVLAPCGRQGVWTPKRWPHFDQLAKLLHEKYPNAQLYIVGTAEDTFPKEIIESLRIIDYRNQLTLSETAWLMKQANLVIGNDSGPMHIADAVQAVGIVIFGPTCQIKNGPLYKTTVISSGQEQTLASQYEEILTTNETHPSLKAITPETIIKTADDILTTNKASHI